MEKIRVKQFFTKKEKKKLVTIMSRLMLLAFGEEHNQDRIKIIKKDMTWFIEEIDKLFIGRVK